MHEFSSVIASSYDAESLAPMLTEKANEGWSVISIVAAGTNVVAYLSRETDAGSSDASSSDDGFTSSADVTAPVSAPESASAPVDDWSTAVDREPDDAVAVTAEATAISPTLPDEISTPSLPDTPTSSPEATAAVEASGEPAGWGAVPASDTSESDTSESDTTDPSGGIDLGLLAASAAPEADDTAPHLPGGIATADDVVADTAAAAAAGTTDSAMSTIEHAGASTSEVAQAAADEVTTPAADTGGVAEQAVDEAAASSSVPAGWYADPSGRFELRYWDGNAWTEHVSRAGQQYTDPPVA